MEGTAEGTIDLRLIGPMAVTQGGAPRPLPASRKTRALLGYLAISGRPERRERLCELLWDVPDDPRGSLRWSLSKLRGVLGEGTARLKADRDWVELELPDAAVDWRRLRALARRGVAGAATADLERAAEAGGELLEGLDLPRCDRFQAWLVAHREDVRQWRAALLAELSGRPIAPDAALGHARAWVEIDGDAPAAWERLIGLLDRMGRAPEAAEQRALGVKRLGEAGRPVPAALRAAPRVPAPATAAPDIRFCTAPDGVCLAYTVEGEGFPIVKPANWMTHLELDHDGPIWRHWIGEFTRGRRLLRYDQRGNGLSDRRARFSFEGFLADLETVVDAAGLERFDLLGISQGASTAIAYAVRHPERVRRIILVGGFARSWAIEGVAPEEVARRQAMVTLTREGWGLDNPAFRQLFTSLFMPDADAAAQAYLNEIQRAATSADNAADIQLAIGATDVRALLPQVRTPTLVVHRTGDAMVPFEAGRALARDIPGARFLALEGRNHMILEDEAAWPRFVDAVRRFLDA